MNFTTLQSENRQKGMALLLAIGFLAVLSILGAVVMRVSTSGLSATVETLPNQRALYAADRTVEYAMNRDIIINLGAFGEVDLAVEDPANPGTALVNSGDNVLSANGATLAVTHDEVINLSGVIDGVSTGTIVSGTVTDVGPRSLPPHLAALHGSEFGANLYHVKVKTKAALNKTTHVDAAIVRLFKMDDDQIFRTSGGG
jgi:hypothetical protein